MEVRIDPAPESIRCPGATVSSADGPDWQPCCVDCSRRVKSTVAYVLKRQRPMAWHQFVPANGECDGRIAPPTAKVD